MYQLSQENVLSIVARSIFWRQSKTHIVCIVILVGTIEFLYETLTEDIHHERFEGSSTECVITEREGVLTGKAQELAERLKREKTRSTLQGEVRKQRLVLEKDLR